MYMYVWVGGWVDVAHVCMGEEGRLEEMKGEVVPHCLKQHPLKSDLMQSLKSSCGSMSPDCPRLVVTSSSVTPPGDPAASDSYLQFLCTTCRS